MCFSYFALQNYKKKMTYTIDASFFMIFYAIIIPVVLPQYGVTKQFKPDRDVQCGRDVVAIWSRKWMQNHIQRIASIGYLQFSVRKDAYSIYTKYIYFLFVKINLHKSKKSSNFASQNRNTN